MVEEGHSGRDAEHAEVEAASSGVKTFLIADVRGYTSFTQEHGDEAAARLAAAFAEAARTGVSLRGGQVIELRGDEALAVFASARQALRAAVELQQRFAELAGQDSGLPMRVGIGLDVGEAVPLEQGYRGAALNRAARLCSNAGPGEVLATENVVHLAGKTEGLEYRDRGRLRLKGLAEPVRVHEVVPTGAPARPRKRKRATGGPRKRIAAAAALAAVAIAAVLVLVLGRSSSANAQIAANSVGEINVSNRLVGQAQVGSGPGRIATGANSIWVANEFGDSVSQVDLATSFVRQTIPVDLDPTALAFGQGALWVACTGTRSLLWISPETYKVLKRIPVGNGPSGVALGPGAVWVTNRLDDTVTEIDSSTGRVLHTFAAGPNPSDITYGFGALWIANESSSAITRLNPQTGGAQTVLVGNGPGAVGVGAGSVWVANTLDGTVSRINPDTDIVESTITVGLGPSSVVVDGGTVWVADSDADELSRIDAGSNTVVKTIPVGNGPQSLAGAGGNLWVSTRAASSVHRGGTLRIVTPADLVSSFDPSADSEPDVLGVTGDGLVGFKRVSGLDGGTPVPDLATSLPTPTNGGLTYSFQLQPGIKYSNGEPVRASDFRRALERDFLLSSPDASYYSVLVGGGTCSKSHCDLSRGVIADDRAGTVTFQLRTPDPELLYQLAVSAADPVPPSVPMKPLDHLGAPGTGPYMVASHSSSKIVLVRNPYFQEWSAAAQPAGYPDRIVFILGKSPGELLTTVEHGKADLDDLVEIGWRAELATRYAAQVHIFPVPGIYGLFLNTRLAPFDKLAARQAVNFAIDRRKALAPFGGTEGASVTCQILPVGTPGYAPYCAYTQRPGGVWNAPDLVRARQLVARSGTRGDKVVVWAPAHQRPAAVARLAVQTLDELGYRASVKLVPLGPSAYFAKVYDPSNRVQAGFVGWASEYPAASQFLSIFTCQSAADANTSASQLCNHGLDRAIDRARVAQSEDPPNLNASWASIDRRVGALAPWVPLVNAREVLVVSRRVGNVQFNPEWGTLIDQLWVK